MLSMETYILLRQRVQEELAAIEHELLDRQGSPEQYAQFIRNKEKCEKLLNEINELLLSIIREKEI